MAANAPDKEPGSEDFRVPKTMLPWLLGFLLGGGGTFGVTSITSEKSLSQSDLDRIEAIVEKAVERSEDAMRTENKLAIQESMGAHLSAYHGQKSQP
jgi:hypothetical protein